MADRLVVMNEGRVRQVGSQRDLYERPADRFVAGFVGRSTFMEGDVEAPGRFRSVGGLLVAVTGGAPGKASLALRPERVELLAPAAQVDNTFEGTVEFVSYLGSQIDAHVRLSASERIVVQLANRPGAPPPAVGSRVRVGWSRDTGHIFPG